MLSPPAANAPRPPLRERLAWPASVVALVAASAAIAALWIGGARHAWPIAIQIAACAAWWIAYQRTPAGSRPWLAAAIAAFAMRAPLWFAPPTYSDDIYRYMWEGRVQVAGENPYLAPPASPLLERLNGDGLADRVNHGHLRAIYPPFAQMIFAGGACFGADASPVAFKLWLALWEAAALAAFALWARRRFGPNRRALAAWQAIALHPLVVVETAGNGHYDLLVAGALALFLFAVARQRFATAGAALGAAFAGKFLPAVAGLPLLWRGRRGALSIAVAGATIALLYVPYLGAGEGLFSSLDVYALKWTRNAPILPALELLSDKSGLAALADRLTWGDDPTKAFFRSRVFGLHPEAPHARQVAKRIASLIFAAIVAGVALRAFLRSLRTGRAPAAEPIALILSASALLLSPILYPWYLPLLAPMIALPLDARRPLATRLAWAWLFAAAPLFCLPVEPSAGDAPLLSELACRWIVFLPFAGLLAAGGRVRNRRFRRLR